MLSSYKNLGSFTLSLLTCAVLLGCHTEKDSYKGPVQGTTKIAKNVESAKTDANQKQHNSAKINSTHFGEDQRFASQVIDVTKNQRYKSSPAYEYNFGELVVNGKPQFRSQGQPEQSDASAVNIISMQGWVRHPKITAKNENKKFPIVVLLHGMHSWNDPSYRGYDYLATNLAEQGYVVISLDANQINALHQGEPSSQARAQLILGTIDKLAQIDEFGGAGDLTALKGKLDFNRIGLMGHSRGGQAVNLAIKFNTTRFGNDISILKKAILAYPKQFALFPNLEAAAKLETDETLLSVISDNNINFAKTTDSTRPYNFKAAITIGPTDFEQIKGIANIPTATLLPSCDGDVSDLQGAFSYDNNRFSLQHDNAPKYQVVIRGANHNFYNTVWTTDDFNVAESERDKATYCSSFRPNTIRQAEADQHKMGQFLINSFFRLYVGDEQQFKAYWNGTAQLPSSACRKGDQTCDERVLLSIQNQGSKVIQRFDSSNASTVNLLGGLNRFEGFDPNGIIACKSFLGIKDTDRISKCSSTKVPFYNTLRMQTYFGGSISFADQLHLSWSQTNASYQLDLAQLTTQGYDSLTFRVALPIDVGQEIYVELTDLEGKTARVTASDFTDALYTIPRKKQNGLPLKTLAEDEQYQGKTAEALNMVSIPLKAFKGIKTDYLKQLKFIYPKGKGGIVMNDIQLQKLRS